MTNEEGYATNNDTNAFQEARKLLNERRSNLLLKETNEIRKKLHKKEDVYSFLKEKEQNGSLANEEKKVLKKIDKYLKNFKKDFTHTILHMASIIYLMNLMKKIITNQQKLRVLLMVAIYYMKVKEIKMLDYQ